MELVGIVRCPVDSLLPYGEGRQVNPDAVKRLAKCFQKTKCRPEEEHNFIRGIITHDDLEQIISTLRVSENTLKRTTLQKTYPLLSGHPIACLDGRHRIRAAVKHKPLSWWVVKLLCVQGSWVEFPLKIALTSINPQIVQDQIESTSRETPYSDAEVYRLVRKYMKNHDKARVEECSSRLSTPKQVSLKGLLKRPQLVRDLDALVKFPGVIGGLQLGNIHKYLALHCDENFSFALRHILAVWEFITDDDPRVNAAISLHDVQCLQFRVPVTSRGDRIAINRMFDQGILLEGIKDLDLRDRVRKRILSLHVIIPSVETFHENMKYISIGVKILRKYLMEVPACKRDKPTLFENLARNWRSPAASFVEHDYGEILQTSETPTAWHAYKTALVAALGEFARLSFEHPRQDIRGETMPAFPEGTRITSLARLALRVGFDNAKIQETSKAPIGHPEVAQYKPQDGRLADWRGGIPFTKSYLQLRSQALLPQLDGPEVTPFFVFRDTINAFFGGSSRIFHEMPDPVDLYCLPLDQPSNGSTTFAPPEDVTMDEPDNEPVDAIEIRGGNQSVSSKVLRPRARRIEKISKRLAREAPPRIDTTRRVELQVNPSSDPLQTILRDTSRSLPASVILEEPNSIQTEAEPQPPTKYQRPGSPVPSEVLNPELGHTILREDGRTPPAIPETPNEQPLASQSEAPQEAEDTIFGNTNAPSTPVQKASQTGSLRESQQVELPPSAGPSRMQHIPTMPERSDRFHVIPTPDDRTSKAAHVSERPPQLFTNSEQTRSLSGEHLTSELDQEPEQVQPKIPAPSRQQVFIMPNRTDRSPITHTPASVAKQAESTMGNTPDASQVSSTHPTPPKRKAPTTPDSPDEEPAHGMQLARRVDLQFGNTTRHFAAIRPDQSIRNPRSSTLISPIRGMQRQRQREATQREVLIRSKKEQSRPTKRPRLHTPEGDVTKVQGRIEFSD